MDTFSRYMRIDAAWMTAHPRRTAAVGSTVPTLLSLLQISTILSQFPDNVNSLFVVPFVLKFAR